MTLAEAVQVQRSAVSHWESAQAKNPSVSHLREIAMATGVQFEWLVTGRGGMTLGPETRMDSVPTAEALLLHTMKIGDRDEMKRVALSDSDLQPLWKRITEM